MNIDTHNKEIKKCQACGGWGKDLINDNEYCNKCSYKYITNTTQTTTYNTDVGKTIVTFGKYNGKTYETVRQSDVSYCNWILKQIDTKGKVFHFQQWLKLNARKVTCECCNGSGLADAI